MQETEQPMEETEATEETERMEATEPIADETAERAGVGEGDGSSESLLGRLPLSRILVTWVELTLVGFGGAALGSFTSGPPQLVVFLATTLLSVAVLLYNVDRLIAERLRG
ncbi:hypothetical protein SAMN04487949_0889 [Halogranum gelatinilyticum]|uniref:Uncharacterized protein n=1 Tax=Halogranum gelatinilyticum TaxID=660521 RepID=A0A1G9QJB7_9EURY|nr:hypothetical protein [Halogranum gelatinilyticum]SDM11089.1 hypothetical protein SAMN04487949_0889 [Halogranum gelatinilyticum]